MLRAVIWAKVYVKHRVFIDQHLDGTKVFRFLVRFAKDPSDTKFLYLKPDKNMNQKFGNDSNYGSRYQYGMLVATSLVTKTKIVRGLGEAPGGDS